MADAKSRYVVRLVMEVLAENPADATQEFVDKLVERGLRDWVYRVENSIDGEILGYFDGFGMPVDLSKMNETEDIMTPEALFAQATQEQQEAGMDADWHSARYRELLVAHNFLPEPEPEPEPVVEDVQLPTSPKGESDAELLAVAAQVNEGS